MHDAALVTGLIQAVLAAMASSWVGLVLGDAMRKVRR
jgi:hypothetical protein